MGGTEHGVHAEDSSAQRGLAVRRAHCPVYNGTVTSTDGNCVGALLVTPTIQSAVTAASDGDTIVRLSGHLQRERRRHRQGAHLPVADTRRRDGGGGSAITLRGVGSSIDGFNLTGATDQTDTPAAFLMGNTETVSNSTFDGDSNAATIFGSNVSLTDNTVQNPNQLFNNSAGTAGLFFKGGGGTGATVKGTAFVGNFEGAAINIADHGVDASNLTIQNNTADTTAGGNVVVAGGTQGLSILGNTVTGSSSSGTGILILGEDSGYLITANKVSGLVNASAVSISSFGDGGVVNGGGTVSGNAFKNNLRGLNVFSASGTILVHLNILVGNSEAAIKNTTKAVASAANNFFGVDGGPGANGCDAVAGNVNASLFLVLSTTVANSKSVTITGGSTGGGAQRDLLRHSVQCARSAIAERALHTSGPRSWAYTARSAVTSTPTRSARTTRFGPGPMATSLGTARTASPAASAEAMPIGESSTARQRLGSRSSSSAARK